VTVRELAAFSAELARAYRRNEADVAEVAALQARRLDELVAVARRTRAYADLTRWADAPPIGKAALMDRFDDHVVAGAPGRAAAQAFLRAGRPGELLDGRFTVTTTSGTTGEVGVFVVDDASFARLRATVFARIFRGQLRAEGFALLARRRYRLRFVVATGGHTMTAVMALRVPRLGRAFADMACLSVDDPLPRLVEQLNAAPPQLLHSYSTVLEVLAHEALRGRLRIAPEIVTAGSEALTATGRANIARAFPKAVVLETWGATEHVALASSCPLGHLHVNEDAAVLEPVDADDRPVPPGVWSDHVLVTNLLNHTQPLLRYRLFDRVRVDPSGCPCGAPFARVQIEGRTDDVIFLDDGHAFQAHPPIPFETALLGTAGLLQFALVHEEQNQLRWVVVVDPAVGVDAVVAAVKQRIHRYLDEHGLAERVTVAVAVVDALPRHPRSRKVRQIMSRVPGPATSVPAATCRGRGAGGARAAIDVRSDVGGHVH
jgi:phenylacetate-coenzyme A ligase PaaK-like adenylate-forming protein